MAGIGRSALSLRFFGENLQPEEVSRLLGVKPTKSHRAGDLTPTGRVQSQGGWWFRVPDAEPGDVEGQIYAIFAAVTDDAGVWSNLNARYHGDLFCGLFMETTNEGLDLKPETLLMIGQRGLRLGLDIYDPIED